MNLKEYKVKSLKKESFRKEYEKFDLLFELSEFFLKMKSLLKSYFK